MKKLLLVIGTVGVIAPALYAQAHRDAVPAGGGLDTLSVILGLVVGLIVGFVLARRLGKK